MDDIFIEFCYYAKLSRKIYNKLSSFALCVSLNLKVHWIDYFTTLLRDCRYLILWLNESDVNISEVRLVFWGPPSARPPKIVCAIEEEKRSPYKFPVIFILIDNNGPGWKTALRSFSQHILNPALEHLSSF